MSKPRTEGVQAQGSGQQQEEAFCRSQKGLCKATTDKERPMVSAYGYYFYVWFFGPISAPNSRKVFP